MHTTVQLSARVNVETCVCQCVCNNMLLIPIGNHAHTHQHSFRFAMEEHVKARATNVGHVVSMQSAWLGTSSDTWTTDNTTVDLGRVVPCASDSKQ